MPEIPDLENIIAFLNGKIPGVRIDSVVPRIPIVIRFPTADDLAKRLEGQILSCVSRRGKFLLFKTESGDTLAVNPMLTGRFQYVEPENENPRQDLLHTEARRWNGPPLPRYAGHG